MINELHMKKNPPEGVLVSGEDTIHDRAALRNDRRRILLLLNPDVFGNFVRVGIECVMRSVLNHLKSLESILHVLFSFIYRVVSGRAIALQADLALCVLTNLLPIKNGVMSDLPHKIVLFRSVESKHN